MTWYKQRELVGTKMVKERRGEVVVTEGGRTGRRKDGRRVERRRVESFKVQSEPSSEKERRRGILCRVEDRV